MVKLNNIKYILEEDEESEVQFVLLRREGGTSTKCKISSYRAWLDFMARSLSYPNINTSKDITYLVKEVDETFHEINLKI